MRDKTTEADDCLIPIGGFIIGFIIGGLVALVVEKTTTLNMEKYPSEVGILGVGVGTFLWILKMKRKKAEKIIRERETEKLKTEEEMRKKEAKEKGKDHIRKFIAIYQDETSLWPSEVSIPDEDIKALKIILQKNNINLPLGQIRAFVTEEIHALHVEKFEASFFRIHPHLSTSPDSFIWAKAYVETFGSSEKHIPLLENLIFKKANLVVSVKQYIDAELEKLALEKRAKEIEKAMRQGGTFTQKPTIQDVDSMGGFEFEEFLGKLFSSMGYKSEVTKSTGDQGADVIIEKLGEKTVVQAKRYSNSVSNSAIQEVVASKAYYKCQKAMVVTNNYFTKSAIELAQSNQVDLWDREKLDEMIKRYL